MRLKHASYGYSGFFDAVKIREDDLDRIYEFDSKLIADVQAIAAAMQSLPRLVASDQLSGSLAAVQEQIKTLDTKLDERDQVLKGMK